MIDKATVERIKSTADIVEVVSDYVHLKRSGSNYMGLCPFHNERTPSFSVNPRKNFCYCFSCHKGGSPVNFIMEKEGISYHDALLQLAKKYGIKVEERELTDEERAAQSKREGMLIVNEWAMQLFENNLRETDEGRNVGLQYFYQRGLTDEAIKRFRLGYAIDRGSSLVEEARKAGHDLELLYETGLIGKSKEGRMYDRFRGRVIYPVLNSAGKVIAFGGRDLKGGPAKYINSPESAIYKKSNELYGIYQAKNEISRQGVCFLVEGYMDVIGMWQSGLENVLASSGTALTDGQIALIHRFADSVTLIYDGDPAGIKAALRGIDMLLAQKLKLKVLLLPDGDDPDSFARKHTPEEFRNFVETNAEDIIRFKTRVMMSEASSDPVKRSEAIHSIVRSIASIPDKIQRITYIQECSRLLNVSDTLIASETEKARGAVIESWRRQRERQELEQRYPVEEKKLPDSDPQKAPDAPAPRTIIKQAPVSTLEPFEREVLRYLLKYGLVTLCSGVDEAGNETPVSTVDFVASELDYERMTFSIPDYSRIFRLIQEMQSQYLADLDTFAAGLEKEQEAKRRQGYDRIAEMQLGVHQIEVEEQKLEENLREEMDTALRDYTTDYAGRILASHEDDAIRSATNRLMRERVVLSKRFRRQAGGESEFERLAELVPRALAEWKDEILRRRLISLTSEMKEASLAGDTDRMPQLQKEAFAIMNMRKEAAKNIGERIISSK